MQIRNSMINFQAMPPQKVERAVIKSALKDGSELFIEISHFEKDGKVKIPNMFVVAQKNGEIVSAKGIHKGDGLSKEAFAGFMDKIEASVADGKKFLREFIDALVK